MKISKTRLVELDIPFGVFAILFFLDTIVIDNVTFHAIAFPIGVGALVIVSLSVFLRWADGKSKKESE